MGADIGLSLVIGADDVTQKLSSTGILSPIPLPRRLDAKKRCSEEQIIGFLKDADAGVPVKALCRWHGSSEASQNRWLSNFMDVIFR